MLFPKGELLLRLVFKRDAVPVRLVLFPKPLVFVPCRLP